LRPKVRRSQLTTTERGIIYGRYLEGCAKVDIAKDFDRTPTCIDLGTSFEVSTVYDSSYDLVVGLHNATTI
jgi:hypothetical protein